MADDPVAKLVSLVGPRLATLTIGMRNPANLSDASKTEVERARQALVLLEQVAEAESMAVARSWFIGENVTVKLTNGWHETRPAIAISNDWYEGAKISAQRMIEDSWS